MANYYLPTYPEPALPEASSSGGGGDLRLGGGLLTEPAAHRYRVDVAIRPVNVLQADGPVWVGSLLFEADVGPIVIVPLVVWHPGAPSEQVRAARAGGLLVLITLEPL